MILSGVGMLRWQRTPAGCQRVLLPQRCQVVKTPHQAASSALPLPGRAKALLNKDKVLS